MNVGRYNVGGGDGDDTTNIDVPIYTHDDHLRTEYLLEYIESEQTRSQPYGPVELISPNHVATIFSGIDGYHMPSRQIDSSSAFLQQTIPSAGSAISTIISPLGNLGNADITLEEHRHTRKILTPVLHDTYRPAEHLINQYSTPLSSPQTSLAALPNDERMPTARGTVNFDFSFHKIFLTDTSNNVDDPATSEIGYLKFFDNQKGVIGMIEARQFMLTGSSKSSTPDRPINYGFIYHPNPTPIEHLATAQLGPLTYKNTGMFGDMFARAWFEDERSPSLHSRWAGLNNPYPTLGTDGRMIVVDYGTSQQRRSQQLVAFSVSEDENKIRKLVGKVNLAPAFNRYGQADLFFGLMTHNGDIKQSSYFLNALDIVIPEQSTIESINHELQQQGHDLSSFFEHSVEINQNLAGMPYSYRAAVPHAITTVSVDDGLSSLAILPVIKGYGRFYGDNMRYRAEFFTIRVAEIDATYFKDEYICTYNTCTPGEDMIKIQGRRYICAPGKSCNPGPDFTSQQKLINAFFQLDPDTSAWKLTFWGMSVYERDTSALSQ